jgi:hypothetical protein
MLRGAPRLSGRGYYLAPGWAKPLLSQLAQAMQRPHPSAIAPLMPAPPAPTPRGFTCCIGAIGSTMAGGAGLGCGAPAIALLIWAPPVVAP